MNKAIGMIEYKTVSQGMYVTDLMLKAADIELIEAQTVCPGKYISIVCGNLSAVKSCIDIAKENHSEHLIDSFILGNPHEMILPALYGTTCIQNMRALGILETFSAASIFIAADEAAKTAQVELIEIRVARGMCGKSYLLLTGEIAAVDAAIEKAKNAVGENAMLLDTAVIANPDRKLWNTIV